jgi:hypothetical protein
MKTDARLTLREVAGRLCGYRQFQKTRTRGRQELLKLLQAGEIRAAFDFPSTARPSILIPAEWWLDVRSGQFQSKLTWSSRRGQRRQFLVEPAKFIGQYVGWFHGSYLGGRSSGESPTDASSELASALTRVNSKQEAYILEGEWAHFVDDAGLEQVEHHDEPTKWSRGRRALGAWEIVLVEVASELLARQGRGLSLEEEQSRVAANAVARAEKLTKRGALIPKVETVTKKIRLILDKKDELSAVDSSNESDPVGRGDEP